MQRIPDSIRGYMRQFTGYMRQINECTISFQGCFRSHTGIRTHRRLSCLRILRSNTFQGPETQCAPGIINGDGSNSFNTILFCCPADDVPVQISFDLC